MKIPDGMDPELWEKMRSTNPGAQAILSRMAEVMKGLTCQERLDAVISAACDFSWGAGQKIRALKARVAELENQLRAARAQ